MRTTRTCTGRGADPVTYVHILREIGKACSATALTFNKQPGRHRAQERLGIHHARRVQVLS